MTSEDIKHQLITWLGRSSGSGRTTEPCGGWRISRILMDRRLAGSRYRRLLIWRSNIGRAGSTPMRTRSRADLVSRAVRIAPDRSRKKMQPLLLDWQRRQLPGATTVWKPGYRSGRRETGRKDKRTTPVYSPSFGGWRMESDRSGKQWRGRIRRSSSTGSGLISWS